jgi:hypothetical protein
VALQLCEYLANLIRIKDLDFLVFDAWRLHCRRNVSGQDFALDGTLESFVQDAAGVTDRTG